MMDKIIIVHYVWVGNAAIEQVEKTLDRLKNNFQHLEDNIISYWIPIKEGDSRVECINPKLVSEEDFNQAKLALDKAQLKIDEIVKAWNNQE
jgi:hypothetical protein